jgi:cell division protein FtsB
VAQVRRLVLPVLLGLAAYYALFGGEYSLFELREARKEVLVQQRELEALRLAVDSLRAWVDSLQSDSATLERLARERFGMVREGEILYRLAEPRATGSDTLP